MTKLSADQLVVANLTDDYIRDLEPENQRYDITLAGDFVISVLPNGIKTWAFIYDFQGRQRRKTLGVFPDMNFGDAKTALERARNAMIRMDEPTEPPDEFARRPAVLGGGHYVSKQRPKRNYKKLLKIAGIIGAVVLLGAAGMWWKNRPPPIAATQPAPNVIDNSPISMPANRATNSNNQDSTTSAPVSTVTQSGSKNDDQVASTTEQAADTNSTSATIGSSDTEPLSPPNPLDTAPEASIATSTNSLDDRESTSSSDNVPAATVATNNSTGEVDYAATQLASTAPVPRPTITTEALANTPTPTPSSAPAEGATAYGGRVARSRMTGEITDLEPADELGPEISYKNSGFTRVFYYTELREFSDGNVVHRWELNGQIIDEVVLKVKKSWRWRTYSSKDLTPGLNGTWQVSTIDATGTILDTETFTYEAR